MGLTQTVAPAEEPVALFRLKEWLKVHPDLKDDDGTIYDLACAARDMIEGGWGLQLVSATWRYTLDRFPGAVGDWCYWAWGERPIELPRSPVTAVASVKYVAAADGTLTTLAATEYEVKLDCDPAVIRPAYGKLWPATRYHPDAVEVTFTAGFGTAPQVPAVLRTAIKAATLLWYEGRAPAGVLPDGAKALVSRYWSGRLTA